MARKNLDSTFSQQAFFGIVFAFFGMVCCATAFSQPISTNKLTMQPTNPLLCDPDSGICALPAASAPNLPNQEIRSGNKLRIVYFTDPICSSCWGIEPQLRRLKLEYGHAVELEYRMGGLLPDWSYNSGGISKPSDVAHHWDEVSAYYQMPIDGDVWLEDPLHSSYPPSIAFKAAQLQDPKKALAFLRRIREMVFLEKKNITKWEHLQAAAVECGLNPLQLRSDYENFGKQHFEEDLALARKMGVRGFPTLFLFDQQNQYKILYGFKPYSALEELLLMIQPSIQKAAYSRELTDLFHEFPTLTSREFAELSGHPVETAVELLEKAVQSGILQKQGSKNGSIWKSISISAPEN
jgi:putative protein-disulfide isomerase